MYVSTQNIEQARQADLYAFLLKEHPGSFKREGNSLRLKSNMSISIRQGYHAFRDFATGEYGNSITFLMNYMGYSFQDAVTSLTGTAQEGGSSQESMASISKKIRDIKLPVEAPRPHKRMYAYLMGRGIPKETIRWLVLKGLVYQSEVSNNVVFVNKEKDYCEIRGTYTLTENPFHGCRKTRADRFWYFLPGEGKPEKAFITEGAIDAVSLFLLHRKNGIENSKHVYISIGGVDNNLTINRIKTRIHTILAVDNDKAGETCRKRHKDLETIIPKLKDWNEDLQDAVM